MITADTITDDACAFVVAMIPTERNKSALAGALGYAEPARNHSRHHLAGQWNGLACAACTLRYLGQNQPTGCIFVGWGHGWQPCHACGGSGLSALGNSILDSRAASKAGAK